MSATDSHEHESPIKTPQQLIVVVVLSFVVPVIGIILIAQLVLGGMNTGDTSSPSAQEAIARRIQPVAEVAISEGGGGASGPRTGDQIVKAACAACHTTGAANAPKIGDNAAWGKLIGRGLNDLLASAIKGKGAMPARGGASDITDFELARAIVVMANQSGGNLKEPPAPKAAK